MIPFFRSKQLIWMALGFALLFWFLESAIHVVVFHEETFIRQLLPFFNPNETWMRLVIVALIFSFGMFAQKMVDQRRRIETQLKKTCSELKWSEREKSGELFVVNRRLLDEITERKKIEAAVRKSREYLHAIIEASPLPIIAVNREGIVTRWNPAAVRNFGWTAGEVLGKPYPLVPDDKWEEYRQLIKRAMQGDTVSGIEVVRRKRDGTRIDVNLWNAAVADVDGRVTSVMAIVEDITQRKRAAKALSWQAAVNAAEAELSAALISPKSIEDISVIALKQAKSVTGSHFGYAGYIDPETGHLVSSTMSRDVWDVCNVPDKKIVFEKFHGLWGWVLNNKKPLLTNEPQIDQRSTGTPEGHIPIHRFLSVPARIGETLVGQISLANPERDFNERDLDFVQRLAALFAIAIERQRVEDKLREAHETLERRVEERTLELTETNKQLAREMKVREQAEQRIRNDKAILQSIIDGISDVLVMVDIDLKVRMLNRAAIKYYGISDYRKIFGRPCYDVFKKRTELCDRCAVPSVMSGGRDVVVDRRGLFDPERSEQVAVYPLKDADDGVTGCIYRVSDVTRQKQIEQQLMRADRLSSLGQLSGGIAHEIRNPLSGIRLLVDVLCDEERFQRSEFETNVFEEINQNIHKIDAIIKRILDFARESTLMQSEISLNRLIEETVRLWYSKLRGLGINLKMVPRQGLETVRGDVVAVQQVINNLIQNAVEAMPDGGTLTIRTDQGNATFSDDRPVAKITIEDTGAGIPEELREKIFNPFFTTKATGTGLGLSISHQIIKHLGGIISCGSEPGRGTAFVIEMPVTERN